MSTCDPSSSTADKSDTGKRLVEGPNDSTKTNGVVITRIPPTADGHLDYVDPNGPTKVALEDNYAQYFEVYKDTEDTSYGMSTLSIAYFPPVDQIPPNVAQMRTPLPQ